MSIVLSPAKRLNFTKIQHDYSISMPENIDKSEQLIRYLRKFSTKKLAEHMNINLKIATVNVIR